MTLFIQKRNNFKMFIKRKRKTTDETRFVYKKRQLWDFFKERKRKNWWDEIGKIDAGKDRAELSRGESPIWTIRKANKQ